MLKHGEAIVDMLGGEIDRIEMKLRVGSEVFCMLIGVFYLFFL